MKNNIYISEILSKDNNNKDKFKGRLLIYNDLQNDKNKKAAGPFYYNEEEKNKCFENNFKSINERKSIKNNNKINPISDKIEVKTENKIIKKKKNLISFVPKEDKNKNLKVNKIKEDYKILDLYIKVFKKNDLNNVRSKNNLINNRNLSANFNGINFEKMKTNVIKIISERVMEKPKLKVCYLTKAFKKKEFFYSLKPILKPKNVISNLEKSYIRRNKKLLLPEKEICYFKRTFITYEMKFKNFVLNKNYFCTKIKENSLKYEEKKAIHEEKNNLNNGGEKSVKKKYFKGINGKNNIDNNNLNDNNSNDNNDNGGHNNEKKEFIKVKSYKSRLNNIKLQSYKTDNQTDIHNKIQKRNEFLQKLNKENKTNNQNEIIKSPQHIENGQNNYSSSSNSSERQKKHSSLFHHLFDKKEKFTEKKNKIFLQKHISKKFDSRNKDIFYKPQLKYSKSLSSNNYKAPRVKFPNIKTSKDLINKINKEISTSDKVNKVTNCSENNLTYNIMNYNHKDIENNLNKNDKSDIYYNNTNNLLNQNYKETKIPNISRRLLEMNKNSNIMRIIRSDYSLTPLQINNNENKSDKGNIFENFKKKNKSITLKRINFSKGNEDMIKNYKSGLLAIKEYFNMK